ncbi:MAG: response regulator [Rickettsiales bacterium]|nr:response regulator [Pseudomonadota bacterium]MDA0966122.1 response regulator [Pseudomonadota bacterium]MDG4543213.1 response regulator [Rickettsiales bacterium]MDG4545411.1 response regulator [Rickettsiales bacterium]MDG4547860.1 response regulator [Rickettsiales bacterium]
MATKNNKASVLVVDDDDMNLDILQHRLTKEGYLSTVIDNGQDAWDLLDSHPNDFSVVLLDKMMPRMGGMEVLSKMKMHPILRNTPVIIQTGDVGSKEATEGIAAGAYYYLTKPFDPDMMIAVVNSAIKNFERQGVAVHNVRNAVCEKAAFELATNARFEIRNTKEALNLSSAIASLAAKPDKVSIAILELIINAIEHGNLCIGYELKKSLSLSNKLDEEIEKRSKSPEHRDKRVYVSVQMKKDDVIVTICDEGQGFNWRKFKEFDPVRLMEPNGRSIAIINSLMDVHVQYHEPGNKVVCTFMRK